MFKIPESLEKMETWCYTISIEKLEDFDSALSSVAQSFGKSMDSAEEPEERIREIKELQESDNSCGKSF